MKPLELLEPKEVEYDSTLDERYAKALSEIRYESDGRITDEDTSDEDAIRELWPKDGSADTLVDFETVLPRKGKISKEEYGFAAAFYGRKSINDRS